MQKTIFLRTEWIDLKAKKLSKSDLLALQEKHFKTAIKQFKEQTKTVPCKITNQYPLDNEIVIEFANKDEEPMIAVLRKAEVVEIIDAQIYDRTHAQAPEPQDFDGVKQQMRAKIENKR